VVDDLRGTMTTSKVSVGSTFAGYRIEGEIGRGGMGVVYRATELSLERPVAIKLIAPELASDEGFRQRFLRESKLAGSLGHPHVLPVYAAGEEEGQLYLAMRFVEGQDLKSLLEREQQLEPERAFRICRQVAEALDAAHAKGLVHRDVKPANVLLDEQGEAYLADFGLTKQVGGASTKTGELAGTLDYLAPEQIRGENVDGRTDGYALACLLYEALSGKPPFRRLTEAETLWAHMQEQPPSLREYQALDPVFARALAKEREERFPSCVELVDAAREALGIETPRLRRRRRLLRRSRALIAAGALVLAGTVAALAITLSGGGEKAEPIGAGVAAIDGQEGRVASVAEFETPPSNVAVGGGAVWVLNTEDETVSRIDPRTGRAVKTFRTGGVPSDIAAGGGVVWVGHGRDTPGPNYTVSVSRVDPDTGRVTHTEKLPDRTKGVPGGLPSMGFPGLAVGAGAVWAINPDGTVSRIDPRTGQLVEVVDARAFLSIAAGKEGVWFIRDEPPSVTRIDPRTNRVAETIPLGASFLYGVAVGAGSVWAAAGDEGLVWRIEPGPTPVTRTIDVGVGAAYIAFGDGAVWVANYVDGTVSRIDPRTNSVTAKVPIGAPQALAAGAGSAWVSTAGATKEGALPAFACGEIESGGRKPDVLIASDLPFQGSAAPRAMADAIRFVLKRRGFRAGKYAVGYQSCDDSTAQTGHFELRKCAANANAYANAARLVAVIGTYNSDCARIEVPILNRVPGGPLAMISPANTYPGLTRGGPGAAGPPVGFRGEPQAYYPTGVRSYARLAGPDDLQGVAQAILAKQLGLRTVYVLHDGDWYGNMVAETFRRAARKLDIAIAGSERFDAQSKSYATLADKVARSGAEGVLVGGAWYAGGDRLLKALRARLDKRVAIMAGDGFTSIPEVLESVGPAALGLYVSTPDVPPSALALGPSGKRFARDFGATPPFGTPLSYVQQAAQAADVVLHAIARSDGTRTSVLRQLRGAEVKDGILGSFRFDRNGDITPAPVMILRVTGKTPPGAGLYPYFEGAVVDRVIRVPARLAR
jgi:YVTN family beta-propeller protein